LDERAFRAKHGQSHTKLPARSNQGNQKTVRR